MTQPWEGAGKLGVHGHLLLQKKFKTSLGYMKTSLKCATMHLTTLGTQQGTRRKERFYQGRGNRLTYCYGDTEAWGDSSEKVKRGRVWKRGISKEIWKEATKRPIGDPVQKPITETKPKPLLKTLPKIYIYMYDRNLNRVHQTIVEQCPN